MSLKALANLVCEASVRTSSDVLTRELERNLPQLRKGVLAFGSPPPPPTSTSALADSHKKLSTFIRELSHFLKVSEEQSKKILATYLSGKFFSLYLSLVDKSSIGLGLKAFGWVPAFLLTGRGLNSRWLLGFVASSGLDVAKCGFDSRCHFSSFLCDF